MGISSMVEMVIHSFEINKHDDRYVVFLKDKHRENYLPIAVGLAEIQALLFKIRGVISTRPLCHDLLLTVIENLDANIKSVTIDEIRHGRLYGSIILNTHAGLLELDARPSDALLLAFSTNVSILVQEKVLHQAGISIGKDNDDSNYSYDCAPVCEPNTIELRKLSAYTDFVRELDTEDLSKDG
jgi:hypothetical protein